MKSILDFLVKSHVEKIKQPVFKLYSSQIEILQEPIDFYLQLHKGVKYSSKRILMSTLYFGTGNLEKYLVAQIDNSIKRNKKLKVGMLMDYMRGNRVNKKQESSRTLVENLKKDNLHNNNVKLAFYYNPSTNKILSLDSESGLREIFGVHHMKFYVFDDDIVLTGANLSEDYFVERQDRYFYIKNAPELANYLQDLFDIISNNSYQVHESGELILFNNQPNPVKQTQKFIKVFKNQFKMFLYSNQIEPKTISFADDNLKPQNSEETILNQEDQKETTENNQEDQQQKLEDEDEEPEIIDITPDNYFQENKQISLELSEKKEKATQLLQNSFNEVEIHQIMRKLEDTLFYEDKRKGGELAELGGPVYFFPTIQLSAINHIQDEQFFLEFLDYIGSNEGYQLKFASGYMNFTDKIIQKIMNSKFQYQLDLLTAAPQANGFFEGGRVKKHIPFFYRYFEYNLLKLASKFNRKNIRINEYQRGQWTFHSKGLWLYENQASNNDGNYTSNPYPVFTAIGSSNYCNRSYQRDTELQFYIYSQCNKFQKELHMEKERQFNYSQDVTEKKLTYKEYGLSLSVVAFAKFLRSFL
ncbi:hypothetical protein ABPG74_014608 [Tetrahymena malaccensis]